MTASTEGLIKLNDAARDTQKIDPSEVQNPLTRKALDKWNRLRGDRRFPSRRDAAPRELSSLLRNIALVRVIQGGADFQFRIIGDASGEVDGGASVSSKSRGIAASARYWRKAAAFLKDAMRG